MVHGIGTVVAFGEGVVDAAAAGHTCASAKGIQDRPTLYLPRNPRSYLHIRLTRELTFAGLDALGKRVSLRVSTVHVPTTSTGATSKCAGIVGDANGARGRGGRCAHFRWYLP